MANQSSNKRGIFLTIMVGYGALQAILLIFSGLIYPFTMLGISSTAGKLTLLVSALELIPLVVALFGIWKWKKWGVYTLIASILLSIMATFVFDIVLKLYSGYAQYVILFDLLVAALWFWAIRRRWSSFK